MNGIYAPIMRALVVGALVLATATLMFVTVNTARAGAGCLGPRGAYDAGSGRARIPRAAGRADRPSK
jgi:hypothetical protein